MKLMWTKCVESFDDLRLHENLPPGIFSRGFEKPSAIQQHAIKLLFGGRDTIGQAQSGNGRTATFTADCLQEIGLRPRNASSIDSRPDA